MRRLVLVAALDLTAAVVVGLLSIPLLVTSNQCDGVVGDCDRTGAKITGVMGKLFLVGGGLFALASWSGFSNVRSCRAAHRKFEGR